MYRHTHYGRLSLYFGEEIKFIALNPTGVGDKDRTSEGGAEDFTSTLEGREGSTVHLNGHRQRPGQSS